jgi:hypothetical protein
LGEKDVEIKIMKREKDSLFHNQIDLSYENKTLKSELEKQKTIMNDRNDTRVSTQPDDSLPTLITPRGGAGGVKNIISSFFGNKK